jgi:hypothetical protein
VETSYSSEILVIIYETAECDTPETAILFAVASRPTQVLCVEWDEHFFSNVQLNGLIISSQCEREDVTKQQRKIWVPFLLCPPQSIILERSPIEQLKIPARETL